ncbi:DUF1772 domain-containing protein [Amycolatopsis anabasis]|uniref:anthrone oxygenase family protein n=1 Tax=Amycolatopsis anabasis TaxID=1840409 RepID=UPI00131AF7C6|nr:anthrone oxygenase family protein [Amycolatopsis anabasis]
MSTWLHTVTLVTALGCGLLGGAFFAFSSFVLHGLGKLPAAQAIEAMQSINASAVRAPFMLAFLGTSALCAVVLVGAVLNGSRGGSALLLIGAAVYLAGNLVLTVVYHVPRNNALAALDPAAPEAAARWREYLSGWTAWNHVRSATGLISAATLTLAALKA